MVNTRKPPDVFRFHGDRDRQNPVPQSKQEREARCRRRKLLARRARRRLPEDLSMLTSATGGSGLRMMATRRSRLRAQKVPPAKNCFHPQRQTSAGLPSAAADVRVRAVKRCGALQRPCERLIRVLSWQMSRQRAAEKLHLFRSSYGLHRHKAPRCRTIPSETFSGVCRMRCRHTAATNPCR